MKTFHILLILVFFSISSYTKMIEEGKRDEVIDKIKFMVFDAFYNAKEKTSDSKEYFLTKYDKHKENNSSKPLNDVIKDVVGDGLDKTSEYYKKASDYFDIEHKKYLEEKAKQK